MRQSRAWEQSRKTSLQPQAENENTPSSCVSGGTWLLKRAKMYLKKEYEQRRNQMIQTLWTLLPAKKKGHRYLDKDKGKDGTTMKIKQVQ
ncbi:hypothetical protein NDU88_004578 [Pleurodeles waltl]|uniref:Uncharacterized protein n=1 Tax=Pleurodeles waltl TaxID=8319 RepID=A0AAV7WSR4_PLEWA|nr:hypothetical protein NDU88_004578 [Pleurodeles waltl]